MLLKKSLRGISNPPAKKSTSQINLQADREHWLRLRRPLKTSRERRSATFSTASTGCGPSTRSRESARIAFTPFRHSTSAFSAYQGPITRCRLKLAVDEILAVTSLMGRCPRRNRSQRAIEQKSVEFMRDESISSFVADKARTVGQNTLPAYSGLSE